MIRKTCKQCGEQFVVEDEDLEFYKKISPTFAGKTFEIPAPSMCFKCRTQGKLAFRNESKFFKIKSALSDKDLISQCSPECRYTIYAQDEWFSDSWDPMSYGRDFDPNRPFFEQLGELNLAVPMPHASLAGNNENSEYIGNSSDAKDCYLISNSTSSERCLYGVSYWHCRDCVDCYKIYNSENCYQVVIGYDNYSCFYSQNITNCAESYFLESCSSCKNCFGCTNLFNKQYWAYNKPSSREEIQNLITVFASSKQKREEIIQKFNKIYLSQPRRYAQIYSSENSSGNYLRNCKNVKNCFFVTEAENVKYSTNLSENSKDVYDCCSPGMGMERVYQSVSMGLGAADMIGCSNVYSNVKNIYYSIYCVNGTSDCFGCVGLKHKQYCILNKQYSKEEYEKLAAQIAEHMQKNNEWGEFLPLNFSFYGYNDSLASYFYPIDQRESKRIVANWTTKDYSVKHSGEFYEPSENIIEYNPRKNSDADRKIKEVLKGVLLCRESNRPFKLLSTEVLFYIKNNLPIPEIHPEIRQAKRFKQCNAFKLYHRQCMCEETGHDHSGRCPNEFETTYAPDRPEKIFCESCYQKSIT